MNMSGKGRGGPRVWSGRFQQKLAERGLRVTSDLGADWDAALFVIGSDGLRRALDHGRTVAYRVAGPYVPRWFEIAGQRMRSEHHALNASMAYALELADTVIYQSEFSRGILDDTLCARQGQSAVIYNGVDLDHFSPARSLRDDVPVLGTAGALRYTYRLKTFFEASKRIEQPHRLLIVGSVDVEASAVLDHYRDDPVVGPRIEYQPHVPPNQLPDFYRRMSVLVHPVSGDGCPNVVVEALACGVPVVAPSFGGTTELVSDAGHIFDYEPWVYDDGFVDAMASAVTDVLADQTALAAKARRRAEAALDIDQMVDAYLTQLGLEHANVAAQPSPSPLQQLGEKVAELAARQRFYTAGAVRRIRRHRQRVAGTASNARPRVAVVAARADVEDEAQSVARALEDAFDFFFITTEAPAPGMSAAGIKAHVQTPEELTQYLRKHDIDIVQVHDARWPIDAALAAAVHGVAGAVGERLHDMSNARADDPGLALRSEAAAYKRFYEGLMEKT